MFSLITGPGVLGTRPTLVYLCPLTWCAVAWARVPQPPSRPSGVLCSAHTSSSCLCQAAAWVWILWKHTDTTLLPVQPPGMGLMGFPGHEGPGGQFLRSGKALSHIDRRRPHLLRPRCAQWAPTTHHCLSGRVVHGQWSMSPPTCSKTCLPFLFDLSTGQHGATAWGTSAPAAA